MMIICIIIAILVMLLLGAGYAVKSRDDLEDDLEDTREDIRDLRQIRYDFMKHMLASPAAKNNPHTNALKKLAVMYNTKITTESLEAKWEEKYVVVMKSFMDYAEAHAPANYKEVFNADNASLIENEQDLDSSRAKYSMLLMRADSYQRFPMAALIMIGDAFSSLIRRGDSMKKQASESYQKRIRDREIAREQELAEAQRRMERRRRREEKELENE